MLPGPGPREEALEPGEAEEDTHWCLRCRRLVHGLQQYVAHRASGCQVSQVIGLYFGKVCTVHCAVKRHIDIA
jgi:hypothetical protein